MNVQTKDGQGRTIYTCSVDGISVPERGGIACELTLEMRGFRVQGIDLCCYASINHCCVIVLKVASEDPKCIEAFTAAIPEITDRLIRCPTSEGDSASADVPEEQKVHIQLTGFDADNLVSDVAAMQARRFRVRTEQFQAHVASKPVGEVLRDCLTISLRTHCADSEDRRRLHGFILELQQWAVAHGFTLKLARCEAASLMAVDGAGTVMAAEMVESWLPDSSRVGRTQG